MSDGRTLFGEAEYDYLSKTVEMDNIGSAKESVNELRKEFREAETRAKRRRIKRAMILAANRGKAMSENPQYSEGTQEEKEKIAKIYREGYEGMDLGTGTIHEKSMKKLEAAGRKDLGDEQMVHAHRRGAA